LSAIEAQARKSWPRGPLPLGFPQFIDLDGFLRRNARTADLGFLVEQKALAGAP